MVSCTGTDHTQQFGKFGFGTIEFMQAVQAEEGADCPVIEPGEEKDSPPESGSCNPQGAQRVSDVVLAVAKRAFAVFPRFPPMDGTQPHEEGLRGIGLQEAFDRPGRTLPPVLQAVFFGCIVIKPRLQRKTGDFPDQQIALRGMQIAAGRIAPQRPAVSPVFFPRRNGEAVFEESGKTVQGQGLDRDRL